MISIYRARSVWFTTAFPVRLAGGSQASALLIKTVKEGGGGSFAVFRVVGWATASALSRLRGTAHGAIACRRAEDYL